jgi:hypothetical protein
MFENRVLRRIFGPKGEEVAEGWKRLCNEELCNLSTSLNIIRVIQVKKDEMGGACSMHVEVRMCTEFWLESLKGRDHSADLGVSGRVMVE